MCARSFSKPVVLVVDDEPLVRDLAIAMVEDAGFDAIGAGTADEALALLRKQAHIDIVFTDVDMPGSMNGLALARSIHDQWPSIGLIVTSGRGRPEGQPPTDKFLPKPYRCETLINTLQMMAA
jgi:CheY-like chemotaxis protein